MNVSFRPAAWEQYLYWQATDKVTFRKISRLIEECLRRPSEGTGKPEPLKGELSGFWSRRIDRDHRLVYRVEAGAILIAQCRFHY